MAEYTLNPKITKLIDDLVNEELFASYHYKSAFAWCALKNYEGGKAFFNKESIDEQEHATGLIDYAADWEHLVRFGDISAPDTFSSLVDIVNYPPTPKAMGWASRVNAPTNVGNLP